MLNVRAFSYTSKYNDLTQKVQNLYSKPSYYLTYSSYSNFPNSSNNVLYSFLLFLFASGSKQNYTSLPQEFKPSIGLVRAYNFNLSSVRVSASFLYVRKKQVDNSLMYQIQIFIFANYLISLSLSKSVRCFWLQVTENPK